MRKRRTQTGWLALIALALHLAVSFGHEHAAEVAAARAGVIQPATTGDGDQNDHHGRDACAICAVLHIDASPIGASASALPLPTVAAAISPAAQDRTGPSHAARQPFQPRAPPRA